MSSQRWMSRIHTRQENDLRVRRLGHSLHGLEITDLHSRGAGKNIGGLTHQLGRLDFGTCRDDLGFTSSLALCSHGQAVLQFLAEDDVLDEHALDLHTPACCGLFNNFTNGLRDLFAALNDILEHARTDDVAESGLCSLDEGDAQVGDSESGFVWAGDVVVDDGGEGEVDIVLGHADLLWHLCGRD